jgi:hypothetical protein
MEIWADGFGQQDGFHLFSLSVKATPEEQQSLWIESRAPSEPNFLMITVAKIPSSEIADIRTRGMPF